EPPEGALDRCGGRVLLYPQDVIGVAHSAKLQRGRGRAKPQPTQPSFGPLCGGDSLGLQRASALAGQDRVHGRRLLTSQTPCLARQASPWSQVSEPFSFT